MVWKYTTDARPDPPARVLAIFRCAGEAGSARIGHFTMEWDGPQWWIDGGRVRPPVCWMEIPPAPWTARRADLDKQPVG